ncbi:MAG: LamG domain-containing protein, partial [Isosphaeraceae bacterium]
ELTQATTTLVNSIIADNVGGDVIGANPTPYDKAMNFDGSNDFYLIPSAGLTNFSEGFSAGFWVNSKNSSVNRYFDIGSGQNNKNILLHRISGTNNLRFWIASPDGGGNNYVDFNNVVTDNVWQYLTVTLDSNRQATLYRDGAAVASGTMLYMPVNAMRTNSYIGRSNWNGENYYEGQMNHFSIWNKALSAAEVRAGMNTVPAADTPGLGAYYPLTEAVVPEKITATIPTTNPTPLGSAYDFNGATDFIQLPSTGLSNFTGGFSIGVWAFPTTNSSYARIIDFGAGASSDNINFLRVSTTNDLQFEVYSGSSGSSIRATNAIELNKWQYFAVSLVPTSATNGTATIYKNGVPIASGTVFLPRNVTRGSSFIGRSNWGDPHYAGQMNHFSLWNRALSAAEVATNMNSAPAAGASGLVMYRPLVDKTVP